MAPSIKNYVTGYRPDYSRTSGGGWYRDSYGNEWKIVDSLPPRGTGDRQATLMPDGRIVERW